MVGDLVWLKSYKKKGNCAKLLPKYVEPYPITEALPHHVYRMERNGKSSIQHEARIRLHVQKDDATIPSTPEQERRECQEDQDSPRDVVIRQKREMLEPSCSSVTVKRRRKQRSSGITFITSQPTLNSHVTSTQQPCDEYPTTTRRCVGSTSY